MADGHASRAYEYTAAALLIRVVFIPPDVGIFIIWRARVPTSTAATYFLVAVAAVAAARAVVVGVGRVVPIVVIVPTYLIRIYL